MGREFHNDNKYMDSFLDDLSEFERELISLDLQKTVKERRGLIASTHRRDKNVFFGLHSRINFALKDLDADSLLVLSYIDIHQFQDYRYLAKKADRIPLSFLYLNKALGISKNSVIKAVDKLIKRGAIIPVNSSKNRSYTTHIRKFGIKYQILTSRFIIRRDISKLFKVFVLKVLMLGTARFRNLGNINAMVEELGMSRSSIKRVLKEAEETGYIYEEEDGILTLDIKSMMLISENEMHRELIENRILIDKLREKLARVIK